MVYQHIQKRHHRRSVATYGLLSGLIGVMWLSTASSLAQQVPVQSPVQITVNSPGDGPVQADAFVTLREAIELVNGTLLLSELSTEEQRLVISSVGRSEIRFSLPVEQTTVELDSVLPAIAQPNVTIDGTTQPGYDDGSSTTAEIFIPTPVVAIRPAPEKEVFRGLTLSADNITVRGLSLYGFNATSQIANATPPADIFISHRPTPLNRESSLPFAGRAAADMPPTGILIDQNWLGLAADESMPETASGFGVSVFDSTGTTIQNNRIEYHNGSAIITGRQADNLKVLQNIIVGNGLAGMPDAIRLDGQVKEGLISSNLICGNDGSGIFIFKPEGAVAIRDNDIRYNGQRLRRAAIYVMGDDHIVENNSIANQKGSGVTVTAFGQGPNTQSNNNVIKDNRFDNIEGLSIDLNVRRTRSPQAFQRGDGPNPMRNSGNRRQDTGNGAVNAPRFESPEFFVMDGDVVMRGVADSGNEVQLYRSVGTIDEYGPLTLPVETVVADDEGRFEFLLNDLVGGEMFSAIATDPRYGTSEPALNTSIRTFAGNTDITSVANAVSTPRCTTAPVPEAPPAPPEQPTPPAPPTVVVPEVLQLEVPRNVHFGLDHDFISAESAIVLDKIITVLEQYPSIVVDLHGHTDSRASVAYNQDLARRRAENTRRYLLSKGIGAERMTIRSLGETELLVAETDRTNFARNRRVEFVFTDVRGVDITFFNQEADLQIEP